MKIKIYLFLFTIVLGVVVVYKVLDSSQTSPIKIGVLMVGNSRLEKFEGLKTGLADLGYHAEDVHFLTENSQENSADLPIKINQLLDKKPDIIVTLGGIETIELKKIFDKNKINLPVVFAGVAAPKEVGIIADEKKPKGQFTGINNYHVSISGKRLEILCNLVPSIQRVHILYDEKTEISKLSLSNTMEAAKVLSIRTKIWDVNEPNFAEKLENQLAPNDALFILPSFRIETLTDQLVRVANKHKLPVMGIYEHEVKKGFLTSYGTSFGDQGYQAARFVSLIIQGNPPGEIPVETPDNIQFLINKREQEQLGIQLNPDLLVIAKFIGTSQGGE